MTTKPLSLGYSPCPNDTYIFHAMVHGLVDPEGVHYKPPVLADVEQLNNWALGHQLDVTKLSFHALGHVLDHYQLLSSGSALGRGCGPLLVARHAFDLAKAENLKIAIPGKLTTAALLLRMFQPAASNLIEMRFDRIILAVMAGSVDCGVIIHESRFTYQQEGLVCLKDLGEWWEQETGLPIPLGCIAARKSLGQDCMQRIERAIRASIMFARKDPTACLPYIREHSQEMETLVVQSHIDLYVNDFSLDLGEEGMAAVREFLARGNNTGVLPDSALI